MTVSDLDLCTLRDNVVRAAVALARADVAHREAFRVVQAAEKADAGVVKARVAFNAACDARMYAVDAVTKAGKLLLHALEGMPPDAA